MNKYRPAALTLATCAAGLSLAACSAGITTAGPATSSPAASRTTASAPASGTTSSTPSTGSTGRSTASTGRSTARTVRAGGSVSFPIPPRAEVIDNTTFDKQIEVVIGSVSPQKASSFYTSALPRAGYTITLNTLGTSGGSTMLAIQFTGHGYKGTIGAGSNLPGVSGSFGKDFLEITLSRR
jgi:hypothetical protein